MISDRGFKRGLRFRVSGLKFGVRGLVFEAWALGFDDLGFGLWGLRFGGRSLRFEVWGCSASCRVRLVSHVRVEIPTTKSEAGALNPQPPRVHLGQRTRIGRSTVSRKLAHLFHAATHTSRFNS